MPTPVINSFTSFNFTKEELAEAYKFTPLNRMALQQEISICAEEKIALKFDPNDPVRFAQQEAELTGKIGILQYLLDQDAALQNL
jgi:hypothetical protein